MSPSGSRPKWSAAPRQVRTTGAAARLARNSSTAAAAAAVARSSAAIRKQQPRDEEDIFCSGFTVKEVDPRLVRAWVIFQLVSLCFQWQLWNEVRGHLYLFDQALLAQCSPGQNRRHHGVCLGPMWNLSCWENVALEGVGLVHGADRRAGSLRGQPPYKHGGRLKTESVTDIDKEIAALERETATRVKELKRRKSALQHVQVALHDPMAALEVANDDLPVNATRSFEFFTRSVPPTFLVAVTPVARARRPGEAPPEANLSAAETEELLSVAWSISVVRTDPPQATPQVLQQHRTGSDVLTFEDLSPEALQTLSSHGRVNWRMTLVNRGLSTRQSRFVVFVEDSAVPHLGEIRSSSQCSFSRSWKAFVQQRQGRSHESLILCRTLLGLFLPLGALATFLVYYCMSGVGEPLRSCCDGYEFHCVVFSKFFFVDVPQQICILLYLLGWYEAEGLRCQLCLFHPGHCQEEHPFRPSNAIALICTLLSSVTNQLLVRPAWKRVQSEEDACWRGFARFAAACMSTLPFTTGTYWATTALLSTPLLAQVAFFIPCMVGWSTVAGMVLCLGYNCCCHES